MFDQGWGARIRLWWRIEEYGVGERKGFGNSALRLTRNSAVYDNVNGGSRGEFSGVSFCFIDSLVSSRAREE